MESCLVGGKQCLENLRLSIIIFANSKVYQNRRMSVFEPICVWVIFILFKIIRLLCYSSKNLPYVRGSVVLSIYKTTNYCLKFLINIPYIIFQLFAIFTSFLEPRNMLFYNQLFYQINHPEAY